MKKTQRESVIFSKATSKSLCVEIKFYSFTYFCRFGFPSAFGLDRLSVLTDPGSNIKSERGRPTTSFLFTSNPEYFNIYLRTKTSFF